MLTEPDEIAGASGGTIRCPLGAGSGSMLTPPSLNCVSVTVIVPATVPCWMDPLWGIVAVVSPAGIVKVIVVPPDANCIAGSL